MAAPFIFVTTYKLKENQLENYREWAKGLVDYVASHEPRLIAFNLYVNEDGTEVSGVQVHPDADSMEYHMGVVTEYIKTAYGEFLDAPLMVLACGEGEAARQMIRQLSPPDSPMTSMPGYIGGFTRSSASG